MREKRTIQIFRTDTWVTTSMKWLKRGDIFRMFDEPASPVYWDGVTEFVCTDPPYLTEDGETWAVSAKPYKEPPGGFTATEENKGRLQNG